MGVLRKQGVVKALPVQRTGGGDAGVQRCCLVGGVGGSGVLRWQQIAVRSRWAGCNALSGKAKRSFRWE